jgi:hypothetical protein
MAASREGERPATVDCHCGWTERFLGRLVDGGGRLPQQNRQDSLDRLASMRQIHLFGHLVQPRPIEGCQPLAALNLAGVAVHCGMTLSLTPLNSCGHTPISRSIAAGASDYVPKPVDTYELVTAIGPWLP